MAASSALISDFWSAANQPRGHEDGVRRLRALIEHTQQPRECQHICSIRKSLWVGGSTQNLRRLAHILLQAALKGCALVGHWPQWVYASVATGKELRERCQATNRSSLHCYFLPISNCTRSSSSTFHFIDSKFDLSRGLDRVANVTGLRSEVLIMGTLLSWVMRPQTELRMAVQRYGEALGFTIADPGARHRHIAMHMRRGDKYSLHPKHMRNHPWRISPETFVAWAQRLSADIGAERVLYMTDDPGVDFAAKGDGLFRAAPAPHACMPSNLAASAVRAAKGSSHSPAAKSLQAIARHPEIVAAQVKGREAELAQVCGPDVLRDDGIQLFAGILLMAQSAAFIGTQISNIGSVVVELMATQRHPPVFRDVLNDMHRSFLSDERVWYGGVHNPASIRPLDVERLKLGDGSVTHGEWLLNDKSKLKGKPAGTGTAAVPVAPGHAVPVSRWG